MRWFVPFVGALFVASLLSADDSGSLVRIDHYVPVKSTAPSTSRATTQIYVRELVLPGIALRGAVQPDRVVLFIHGAGTPAEVSFDVSYQDYSWMRYLALAGFDVFAMDMTGYGRSTRPMQMNDPCNLAPPQQTAFVPSLLEAPCAASFPHPLTTMASDWNDIATVVDHVRSLRHVERLNLFGWSQGGPRAGGYTAQHPEKVQKLVLLAPAYNRKGPTLPPAESPSGVSVMNTQSHAEFTANWDRQTGCPDQYDAKTSDAVWSQMLDSDPVGASWGTGVRRAPQVPSWGFNSDVVTKMQTPTLMVSGVYDKQVPQERVREMYADLGSPQKVFIDLACSSHNAMWERNHLLLFEASLEWLTQGAVKGTKEGLLRLGY